jgi:hypothetical protein
MLRTTKLPVALEGYASTTIWKSEAASAATGFASSGLQTKSIRFRVSAHAF